jgi:glycosyltransferase involved in cell wall biosynthesis
MRVALDGTPLLGARTGVGAVVAGFVGALADRPDIDVVAYAVTWAGRDQFAASLPPSVQAASRPFPARVVRELWARLDEPRIERWTGAVDVVHALNFVAPPARVPVIVMVHDLTFVRFPELCTPDTLRYPDAIRRALARGAHLHVPSDFVADEVRDEFGLEPDRVTRIYSGLAPTGGGDADAGRRRAGASRYVLALGTVEPRKNLPRLVAAFDTLASEDPEARLVVAGPDGWGTGAFTEAVAHAHHRHRVHRLGWVDPKDRRDLLAGAAAFAYPSLYEGFGIPPLEAMAAGTPVVAARAGAIPEIVGDAAELVDPHDADALAAALHRVLNDAAHRARLVALGTERAARFTWTQAAAEAVALYGLLS